LRNIMIIKYSLTKLLALPLLFGLLSFTAPTFSATKIMPLGDSITGSPGCWRAYLWRKLQAGGYTNIDMVGTLPAPGCGFTYDGNNEGHGGYLVTNIASQSLLPGWLSATNPDIVLMHLGTNDVWNGRSTATILSAYTTLVKQMRAKNSAMKIIVAKIIPMDSSRSCGSCANGVIALNNAIPGWASGLSTSASPITVVDQWSGFSATSDTSDGVHPTDGGHQKMANKMYPVLVAALGSTSSPAGGKCNVYGTTYPICANTSSGWGWENNASCIANADCKALPAPYGVIGSTTTTKTKCNWNGTVFPLCKNISSGWGWENNASCVGLTDCSTLTAPYGPF
jgi:lysophospholipase L1-like esterase